MQRKTLYGLGLLCLWLFCLYCPLDAAAQPPKQEALTELMALVRTLVVTGHPAGDYIPKDSSAAQEESTAEEEEENNGNPRFSDNISYIEGKLEAILDVIDIPRVQPDTSDERRIARFEEHLPSVPFMEFLTRWRGKMRTGGDTRIPDQWHCVYMIGGSGRYFQGNLALCPIGLFTLEQVNHVIATLKARSSYTSPPPTKQEATASRSFAAKVHGLEAARHPSPEVSTEYLIFEQAELGESKGAKIIITQEKPGQYALFLLMGNEDFMHEATVGNDEEE